MRAPSRLSKQKLRKQDACMLGHWLLTYLGLARTHLVQLLIVPGAREREAKRKAPSTAGSTGDCETALRPPGLRTGSQGCLSLNKRMNKRMRLTCLGATRPLRAS
ncbi:unnamed protein product [Polarella glacialis]|uniref:Uncharacterized protein n=1 Tax=Polarella glacialis TaxID=89957 RepID=A0A813FAM6_POLGL|nr:unnamed protein product [Polarella glacialis]